MFRRSTTQIARHLSSSKQATEHFSLARNLHQLPGAIARGLARPTVLDIHTPVIAVSTLSGAYAGYKISNDKYTTAFGPSSLFKKTAHTFGGATAGYIASLSSVILLADVRLLTLAGIGCIYKTARDCITIEKTEDTPTPPSPGR